MPKFLQMVREKGTIKWETAIKKLTAEPAAWLGLTMRGLIKPNYAADVVIFDPQSIADVADYKTPDIFSHGIDMVFVNGQLAFSDKHKFNLNGQVLTR